MIMNYRQEMLSSISVSRSSLKEIPAVAAARGKRLVGVMPGIVLVSSTYISLFFRIISVLL